MKMISKAIAVSLVSGGPLLIAQATNAQNSAPPPATASRPSTPDQTSLPNNNVPASRTQTTGHDNQDPKIRQMNQKEKDKVEREGK